MFSLHIGVTELDLESAPPPEEIVPYVAVHSVFLVGNVFRIFLRDNLELVTSCFLDDSKSHRYEVVLIFISLMIKDIKHLFMYPLAV